MRSKSRWHVLLSISAALSACSKVDDDAPAVDVVDIPELGNSDSSAETSGLLPYVGCNGEVFGPIETSGDYLLIDVPDDAAPLGCVKSPPETESALDCPSDVIESTGLAGTSFGISEFLVTIGDVRFCESDLNCRPPPECMRGGDYDPFPCGWIADDFCNTIGGHLCTEVELERASRGPGAYAFPWGNDPPEVCKLPGESVEDFVRRRDISPYGLRGTLTDRVAAGNRYWTPTDSIQDFCDGVPCWSGDPGPSNRVSRGGVLSQGTYLPLYHRERSSWGPAYARCCTGTYD
jgi:hypothetical protein